MLSPEPSSPPPRRRCRRAKRKVRPPPPDNAAPSPDLATAFYGLAPPRGVLHTITKASASTVEQQKAREGRSERFEQEVGEKEEREAQGNETVKEVDEPAPTLRLKRLAEPVSRQLDINPTSSSSSSANLAPPPPAQAGPSRLQTGFTLTPLPSRSSVSSASTAAAQQANLPSLHQQPLPQLNTVSPATRLRSRRGSTLGRVPDPQWAANVLEPIFRADTAAAAAGKEKEKKGKGKEGRGSLGWHALQGGSGAPSMEGPLSTDEFILNVLPETTLKVAKKQDHRVERRLTRDKHQMAPRLLKGKGKEPAVRRRQEPPRRDYTSSEEDEDGSSSERSLLDPADVLHHAPTPKLFRMSTFLGGAELDTATSKEKDRLLRRAPYATPAGGKDPLSFDTASHTLFGQEKVLLPLHTGAKQRKRQRKEDDEDEGPVKRLPPGKDVRTPFITNIRQTAFAPLVNRPAGKEKQRAPDGMRTLAQLEDEVDQVVEGIVEGRPAGRATVRRKSVTLARPGEGRMETLELGTAEEAGAVVEQNPRVNKARPPRELVVTLPTSRKPPTSHLKYRFIPRRLPPPRRRNPLPGLSPIDENCAASARPAPAPVMGSSRPPEKANNALESPSSPRAPLAAAARSPVKTKQTGFRFVTGCKARKAPPVEGRQAVAAFSSSVSNPAPSGSTDTLPSLQPAQSRPRLETAAHPAHPVETSPPKRKRSVVLVTPGPLEQGSRRADSDPEGGPQRKKRALLRRLSTRPDFQLPTSPVPVNASGSNGGDEGIHFSSHEYGAQATGRSVSLPPELDSRPPASDHSHDTSPSRRVFADVPISPELFADAFPPAGQSDALPAPSGYFEDESPSFLRQALQAAEVAEGVFHGGQGGGASGGGRGVASSKPEDARPAAHSSSSADSPLLRRRRLPSLAQPPSTQTSGIWSRIPSCRSGGSEAPDDAAAGEEQAVRGERWSGLFSVIPDEDEPTPSHVSATPEGAGLAEGDDEQQPPTSVLAIDEHDQLDEDDLSSTSLASDADVTRPPPGRRLCRQKGSVGAR